MTIKFFIPIVILAFASCRQSDKLSDKFKTGLINFSVSKSHVTQQLENDMPLEFGALWMGFNKINVRTNHDTLIADVNVELSTSLNYDGGFELIGDTLFLYAKCLDNEQNKKTVHSTLNYKISSTGLQYKEIDFKELK
jgi:hypothetical protein